jgi:hypothetical protein
MSTTLEDDPPPSEQSSILDEMVENLRQTSVDSSMGKHWCFGRTMTDMAKFSDVLNMVAQLVEWCDERNNIGSDGSPILHKKQLVNLYGYLYDMLVSNLRYFSEEIETCEDRYADTPLVNIYITAAIIFLFNSKVWPNFDSVVDMTQGEIPYCVDHGLDVVSNAPISNFSVEEWLASVDMIAYSKDRLLYCEELITYIDALEMRLCQILLNCYDRRVHNIKSFRSRIRTVPGGYMLASSGEFHCIMAMLSLRFTVNGALEQLRSYTAPMYIDADIKLAARIQAVLVERAFRIYDVSYKTDFKKQYVAASTTIMEGFLFLKTRNNAEVRHDIAIRQFRVAPDWMKISERVAPDRLKIHEFLRRPTEDVLAFKLAFRMVMNLIFLETINVSFLDYYYTGYEFLCSYVHEFDKILEKSDTIPLFVESFSDACILTQRKLVVFGKDPIDYLMAFIYWMERVVVLCNYRLSAAIHIHKLMNELFGTHVAPQEENAQTVNQVSLLAQRLEKMLDLQENQTFTSLEDLDNITPPQSPASSSFYFSSSSSSSSSQGMPMTKRTELPSMDEPLIETETVSYFTSLFSDRVQERLQYEAINKIIPEPGEELDSTPAFANLDEMGLPPNSKCGWTD